MFNIAWSGKALLMSCNFRSSDMVLDAVNSQFTLMMTPDVCDVDYARGSVMEKGGGYREYPGRVQVHFLGKQEKAPKKDRKVYSVRENAEKENAEENKDAKMIMEIIKDERTEENRAAKMIMKIIIMRKIY